MPYGVSHFFGKLPNIFDDFSVLSILLTKNATKVDKSGQGEYLTMNSRHFLLSCNTFWRSSDFFGHYWTIQIRVICEEISLLHVIRGSLHTVDISSTTYQPFLVNVVCEHPHRSRKQLSWQMCITKCQPQCWQQLLTFGVCNLIFDKVRLIYWLKNTAD